MMNVVIHFYVVLVFVCGSHALPKKEKLNDSNLNTCLFDCGRCVGILGEDKYKRDACMEKCEETNGASRDPDCKNSDFVKVNKLDACFNACAHCTFIHGKSVYIGGACLKECRKTKGKSIDPECKNPEFLMTEAERECLASCEECMDVDYMYGVCTSLCRSTKGASNDPECTSLLMNSGSNQTKEKDDCLSSCEKCNDENYMYKACKYLCNSTNGASNDPNCTKFQNKSGK